MLGRAFTEMHIRHLRGRGTSEDVLEKDVLNYEGQLSSWRLATDVLKLDYKDLWDREEEICCFLDLRVSLPVKEPRASKDARFSFNAELFESLRKLYQSFPH